MTVRLHQGWYLSPGVSLSLFLVALFAPLTAEALPRYSAQYGQKCSLCHTNPTGGGLRTLYASQYLVPTELSMTQLTPEQMKKIRPDLTPAITAGVDLRTLLYAGSEDRSGTIAMQGDLYVAVQAGEKFLAYLDQGRGGTQEFFGSAYVLPANGYFKAGRFAPDYGWRWGDHQMYSRRYLLDENGTDVPSTLNSSGLEVGGHGGIVRASAAVLEGTGTHGESYSAKIVLRYNPGPFNLALGGSLLRREESAGHKRAGGVFGYVAVGPVTWVAEVDETGNPERQGMLVSNELAWEVVRGLAIRGTYSFQDPDRDLKSGTRSRYGLGVDTLITPFFGVQLMGNQYAFETGSFVNQDDYTQGELILHFLY